MTGTSSGPERHQQDSPLYEQDDSLIDTVLSRATADPKLPEEAKLLILAALSSDDDLADAIESPRVAADPRPASTTVPARAFLSSVTVRGFRGIGPETTLTLTPAPGLTVIAGRNGTGKSSFAEALGGVANPR